MSSTITLQVAESNYFLYQEYHQPKELALTDASFALAKGKESGRIVLGVQGTRIVKIEKSQWCVGRFFQAIGNFFRRIDTNPVKVDTLFDESKRVKKPIVGFVENVFVAFAKGVYHVLPKNI